MPRDIELLRDLWTYIDPHCGIASDKVAKAESERWRAKESVRIRSAIIIAGRKVDRLRAIVRLDKIKGGFRGFCLQTKIPIN
jgi:hypothetical protein